MKMRLPLLNFSVTSFKRFPRALKTFDEKEINLKIESQSGIPSGFLFLNKGSVFFKRIHQNVIKLYRSTLGQNPFLNLAIKPANGVIHAKWYRKPDCMISKTTAHLAAAKIQVIMSTLRTVVKIRAQNSTVNFWNKQKKGYTKSNISAVRHTKGFGRTCWFSSSVTYSRRNRVISLEMRTW